MRIGSGWDLHILLEGRPLMLGGIEVPSPKGEKAHSDGDVLLHAVIDALLGACALGDIGTHFPPTDIKWKDADSRELLKQTLKMVEDAGYQPVNIDCTIILQSPKLGPHKEKIRSQLARDLKLTADRVSVKAKTKEGVDAAGRGEAIEASAVVLLETMNV